jgi:hypothetical protein
MRFHRRFTSLSVNCLFSNFCTKFFALTKLLSSIFIDEQETSNLQKFLVKFRGLLVIFTLFDHVTHLVLYLNANRYLGKCGHFTAIGYLVVCSLLWTLRIYDELRRANNQLHLIISKYFVRRFYRNYIPLLIYILMIKYVTSLDNKHDSFTSLFNDNNGIIWWHIVAPFFAYFIFLTKTQRIPRVYFNSFALIIVFCDATKHAPFMVRKVSLYFKCALLVIFYYHCDKVKLIRKWRKFLKLNFITAFVLMLFYFKLLRSNSSSFEQQHHGIKSLFMYYWLLFLFSLLVFVPMRLTDVFNERFLTKMSNITFIRYLCHRYALYIVFDYIPGIGLDVESQQNGIMSFLKHDFGRFFLVLTLSYSFSFVFHYLVTIHLQKMHSFTCSQIASFFVKKTPQLSVINIEC